MSLDRLNLSPWDGLSLLNREAEVRDPESIRSAWADDSALLLRSSCWILSEPQPSGN